MSQSLSPSATQPIDTVPHNALVIDQHGTIQSLNSRWRACCKEYSLPPQLAKVGSNYLELLPEWVVEPTLLHNVLKSTLGGEHLVVSTDSTILCIPKGRRVFRFEAFPLLPVLSPDKPMWVIAHQDAGPVVEGRHIQPLAAHRSTIKQAAFKFIPICASCKSIRNNREEWLTIERFLQMQLQVQFTHDICPECVRQLYPQYAGAFKETSGHT
ncbi:hypothetical protein A8L34_29705 [Bacillus sp. FJAT-27264]|uniref:hypothetical protein n=1 Tax=Paenibacillus sp. (strain DSM 101736 / FJAT-27264) TaxID=1850362 RepID=UPI000807A435|nr:hypothetical protein [Bacillus sp. FJAT-27264]OBZ12888.1 hypothetical protein A8L34_29705 [Bacillus sp. FJAT-27264]